DPNDLTAQRVAGVRWVFAEGKWKQVPDPMPRVRLVTHAQVSRAVYDDLRRIDPRQVALVDEVVDLDAANPGIARVVVDRPGFIEVATTAATRQLLVLTESFHPGWQATDGGRALRILRVYGDFQACLVEPGERTIIFRFRPASFRYGGMLSLVATFIVALCFAFQWRKARRKD
ncbi:MAG: hypothetical protein ACHQ7N_16045, partial [Candidatus Methylomirabilales bacterium]